MVSSRHERRQVRRTWTWRLAGRAGPLSCPCLSWSRRQVSRRPSQPLSESNPFRHLHSFTLPELLLHEAERTGQACFSSVCASAPPAGHRLSFAATVNVRRLGSNPPHSPAGHRLSFASAPCRPSFASQRGVRPDPLLKAGSGLAGAHQLGKNVNRLPRF